MTLALGTKLWCLTKPTSTFNLWVIYVSWPSSWLLHWHSGHNPVPSTLPILIPICTQFVLYLLLPFPIYSFSRFFCPLMGLFPSVLSFRHSRCDYTQKTCTRLGSLAFHQEERHCVASTSPHRQLIFSGERGWCSYQTPKCSSRTYRQLTVVRREEGHEVPLLPDEAQAVGSCWGRGRYFLKNYSHQKGPRTL